MENIESLDCKRVDKKLEIISNSSDDLVDSLSMNKEKALKLLDKAKSAEGRVKLFSKRMDDF